MPALILTLLAYGAIAGCDQRDKRVATRFQIASASMVPRWRGPHFLATCTKCKQTEAIACDTFERLLPTRCYRCGHTCTIGEEVWPGDVVTVEPIAVQAPLQRFDVIVIDHDLQRAEPHGTPSLAVKRIWGMPGERVELRDGELWIHGTQFQKSLQQLARVAIPLSSYPDDPHQHWWHLRKEHVEPQLLRASKQALPLRLNAGERLLFVYHQPGRSPDTRTLEPARIVDDYISNQNSTAIFHAVPDILVAFELAEACHSPWRVQFQLGKYDCCLHIEPFVEQNVVSAEQSSHSNYSIPCHSSVVVAVCDGRLLALSDVADRQWQLQGNERASRVERIETVDGPKDVFTHAQVVVDVVDGLEIANVSVGRDLWLGPRESRQDYWNADQQWGTGYFVLGDNLPVSQDSRDPTMGRIARAKILGFLADTPRVEWRQLAQPKMP
jgi:hypothetical protein